MSEHPREDQTEGEESEFLDRLEDLDTTEEEADEVQGGLTMRKAGKGQQEY
jgi:hypothetical protein